MADPFTKFGGRALDTPEADPFSKFGGKALKPSPGEDWSNPLINEEGLTSEERKFVQRNAKSPEEAVKWLSTPPGTGGRPKGEEDRRRFVKSGPGRFDYDYATIPFKEYEAKIYKPGGNYIAVRPKGSSEKWKVVDPERAEMADVSDLISANDVALSALPVPGLGPAASFGGKVLKSMAQGAFTGGITEAGRQVEGAQGGLDRPLGEAAKDVAMSSAMGGVLNPVAEGAISGAKNLVGQAARGVGSALELPRKGIKAATGLADEEILKKEAARLSLDKKDTMRQGRAPIRGQINQMNLETKPAIQATKDAAAVLEKEKEAARAATDAGRKRIAGIAEGMKASRPKATAMTLEDATARKPEAGVSRRAADANQSEITASIVRPDKAKGTATFEGLGTGTPDPAEGLDAATLNAWPQIADDMREVYGKNAVYEAGSKAMEARKVFHGRLKREMGDEAYARLHPEWQRRWATRMEEDPLYQSFFKGKTNDSRIAKIKSGTATPEDVAAMTEIRNIIAREKRTPSSLSDALRAYQKTLPAYKDALAKRHAKSEEVRVSRNDLMGKGDEFDSRISGVQRKLNEMEEPSRSGAMEYTASIGRVIKRGGEKLLGMSKPVLAVKAKTAPPVVRPIIKKLIAALERGGVAAMADEVEVHWNSNPAFRTWVLGKGLAGQVSQKGEDK